MTITNALRNGPAAPPRPPQASGPEWFRMARSEADDKLGEIYVYDVIDSWWGVSAQSFVEALVGLGDVDRINLYVNSPGGSVYEALAMRAALSRHEAHVTAYVDGMAASAASFLITGANEIVMSAGAEIMIHDASVIAWGNAEDHRDAATDLDRISNNIAGMYASRAGGDVADWRALMLAETWYSDQEAVAAGLADRVDAAPKPATEDKAANVFDLSAFAHAGREAAPDPLSPAAIATARRKLVAERNHTPAEADARITASMLERRGPRPAEPGTTTTTNQEGVDHMADIIKGLRDRLGIKPEATLTDEQLLEAVDEALTERAEPTTNTTTVPAGTVVVDEAALAELRQDAAAGRAARDEQIGSRRDGVVDAAIRAGKVPVARRAHYRTLLDADEEGTTDLLNKLEGGAVVNVTPTGYTGGISESATDSDDSLFSTFYPSATTTTTSEV
jgi:ATP-dependent protease ClpP protease subunit